MVMRKALQVALRHDGRPSGLSISELAQRARLTYEAARHTLRRDHKLRAAVQLAIQALPRRRLLWAERELRAQGRPVTMASLAACALIAKSKSNDDIMRAMIADHGSSAGGTRTPKQRGSKTSARLPPSPVL